MRYTPQGRNAPGAAASLALLLVLLAGSGLKTGLVAAAGDRPLGLPRPGTLDGLGVNIHFTHARPGELEMIAAGGFRFVRMDFSWEGCEHDQGRYDFAAYDHLLADLDRLGLRAYFILDYGHRLYDGGLSPHSEAGRAAFCAFVTATMQHFAGRGVVWEMWNEPNIGFWKPQPDAEAYAALALAVGKTIRAVAPQEVFVGPTTSEIDLAFMTTCFKAGCLPYWDAVSVHPYRHRPPETVADDYRTMRDLIRRNYLVDAVSAVKRPGILSGEWGYSSSLDGWGQGYDAVRQGQYLARQWLTNLANEVPISIWYDWHDDGTDPKEAEHNFGTVRHAYREGQAEVYEPKPAYLAAKTLTTVLKGYEFSKALALKEDEHVLLFAKGDQLRLAAWTSGNAPCTVTVPASPGRFRATGHLGQELPELVADAQGLTLTLTGEVQYLAPIDANPSLRLAVAWERMPLDVVVSLPSPWAPVTRDPPPPISVVHPGSMQMALALRFTNPLERPVQVERSADKLAYDRSLTLPAILTFGERAAVSPPLSTALNVDGRMVWIQSCTPVVTNPLTLQILAPTPAGDQTSIPILIDNSEGNEFSGRISVLSANKEVLAEKDVIHFPSHQVQVVPLTLNMPSAGNVRLGVQIDGGKGAALIRSLPIHTYTPLPTAFATWQVFTDGDAKVPSTHTFTAGHAQVLPSLVDQPTLDLGYHLDQGWKFLRITPTRPIDLGAAREIGMWVFGDGSGNVARLRVVDASGQTFQPDGGRLDFTYWKWLTFAITPHTAHWGGTNDGVAKAPLKLDTLFLLDHGDQSRASGGAIRIAGAMAVE